VKVRGELELLGRSAPLTFTLTDDGGHLTGSATIKQSDWGIKPYSALFGALKVNDDVTVEVEGNLS
jgi:polyisoprenoid-binding protein YceI